MTETLKEAKYKGRDVTLNKPFRLSGDNKTGQKTHGVYVENPETGNVILVKFGHEMPDRDDNPDAKRNFRKRHDCDSKSDKTSPGYWSCKQWEKFDDNPKSNKEKMTNELIEEIIKLEKSLEAMGNNPIEQNPKNMGIKPITTKEPNVPKDKENKDEIEEDGFYRRKVEKEFIEVMATFNRLSEKKIYVQDPFDAPPGVNVQVGPDGGYYYEFETGQSSGNTPKEDKKKPMGKKKVDLGKPQ